MAAAPPPPAAHGEGVFKYRYAKPSGTVDMAVVAMPTADLPPRILLIERGADPYAGCWATPGGFVDPGPDGLGENLLAAAKRELLEETCVDADQLGLQILEVHAYGDPGRDPRGWTISAAFTVLVPTSDLGAKGADDAAKAEWVDVASLAAMRLAFDHGRIVRDCLTHLAARSPPAMLSAKCPGGQTVREYLAAAAAAIAVPAPVEPPLVLSNEKAVRTEHVYKFAHPNWSVDTAIVAGPAGPLPPRLLLIERGGAPFKGSWAFPGGFVDAGPGEMGEMLEFAAKRELLEETAVNANDKGLTMHYVGSFGDPGRDPRGWTITTAFAVLVPNAELKATGGDDAAKAEWFDVASVATMSLAFDHMKVARACFAFLASAEAPAALAQVCPNGQTTKEYLSAAAEAIAAKLASQPGGS